MARCWAIPVKAHQAGEYHYSQCVPNGLLPLDVLTNQIICDHLYSTTDKCSAENRADAGGAFLRP